MGRGLDLGREGVLNRTEAEQGRGRGRDQEQKLRLTAGCGPHAINRNGNGPKGQQLGGSFQQAQEKRGVLVLLLLFPNLLLLLVLLGWWWSRYSLTWDSSGCIVESLGRPY